GIVEHEIKGLCARYLAQEDDVVAHADDPARFDERQRAALAWTLAIAYDSNLADAALWERLRAAGAGLLGKTVLHEFAYGTGCDPTRNPWDLQRTPGGSSGGSAAALDARMVPVAAGVACWLLAVALRPDRSWLARVVGSPLLLWIGVPLLLLAPALLWWRRAPRRPAHAEPVSTVATPVDVDDAGRKPAIGDRRSLIDRLDRRIGQWRPGSAGFALAEMHLLGLDLLENIADEASSQHVQQAVAQRLAAEFGTEHLAVLGPGSFAVILEVAGDRSAAEAMVPQLAALLARRIEVDALPVELRSRIGIALFPTDATGAPALVRAARIACGAAHKQMVAGVCYEPGLQPDRRDLTLLAELHEAIRSGQLGYALQPKLDLKLRRWVGAELLVRWNHPQHGPLAPYAFVPLAEQAGVIGEMTLYLIQRGLEHCRQWQQLGHSLSLSVNVSANDLADLTLVAAIIEGSGELGARLMLEVTETDIMRNPERIAEAVLQMRQHGIRISLDDFGTGHSSLTNLRRLDPDELKIDRSFVQALRHSPSDQAIVRATIRLAHDLGASVTAEGIEDEATLEWLTEAGCNAAQGFALARPMTPAQFAELLQAQRD
ncbi:MAG: EAL domain-containing protein, partial [Proteobacteria bacterium]|nr:EAL domain-containing protein [Pseudomonadota bacterium]